MPGQRSAPAGGLAEAHGSENAAVDALAAELDGVEITPQGDAHAAALLEAALAYCPLTVPLEGKRPTLRDWPNWRATPETVRAHWQRTPRANVGIRTGASLVVVDIDPRAGGDDVLADLEHEHGTLPESVECRTGAGGRHVYLAGPHDLASFDLGAGLEIKAGGRQVVAPPSVHPETAALYEWLPGRAPGEIERALVPEWVLEQRPRAAERAGRRTPAHQWVALVSEGYAEGARNAGLAALIGHLLAKDVDAHLTAEIAHLVNAERFRPPLPAPEVDAVVRSIAGREVRRRKAGQR